MGKPTAKKREPIKRQTSNSSIHKKTQKGGKQKLKQKIIQEAAGPSNGTRLKKTGLVNLVKQNGKVKVKPGRFVLAPPRTPSEDSNSEAEDYVDQFFEDVVINDGEETPESSSEESEPSEESDDDGVDEEEFGEEEEEEADDSDDEAEDDSDSDSSTSYDYQFSPSEVVLDPNMMVDDDDEPYPFDPADCEEIDIESYDESESETSSSESDPDEFVHANPRFLEVDDSKIPFPSDGPAIIELDDDGDSCPELVPIPDSFKNAPASTSKATSTAKPTAPQTNGQPKVAPKKPTVVPSQDAPQPANLDCYFSQDYSEVLVHLKEPVYVHGLLSLRVIAGGIEILHHTRRATDSNSKEIVIMATVDDYPVKISTISQPTHALTRGLADPAMKRFHYSDLMGIKQSFESHHAILLLKSLHKESHIKFMEGHMSKKILPEEFRNTPENILHCQFYASHPKQFSPVSEELLVEQPNSRFPRIITVGGKNTGKSTFNKCLINSLLSSGNSQVLYVDLDIGQPELGVPQSISAYLLDSPVIGKGFLQCDRMEPYFSLVYGHLNVQLDVIRYAKCVKAFFDKLNEDSDLTPLPWVVNTMGYVKGVGLDLMHWIMVQLRPTRVLQFKHPVHHLENFPVKLDSQFMRRHESMVLNQGGDGSGDWDFDWIGVPGYEGNRAEDVKQLKGSEGRQMNILCHLGLALKENFATSLNEVDAFCAPLSQLKIRYVGEDSSMTDCPVEAINGNMVYLCHASDDDTTFLQYLGMGLVRAVDEHDKKVYLVTGLDRRHLKNVNCLALTSIPLPLQVLTSQTTTSVGSDRPVVGYICQAGPQSVLFRNVIDRPFRTDTASKR